jgi:predicted metal-dependent phosphoesterase TrpH
MNRATFIEKLTAVRQSVEQLLAQLQASEADKFVAHLYQARKQYRLVCERPNKANKAIEREVVSSYQVAQNLGFNGDFRSWEHLLRIHE